MPRKPDPALKLTRQLRSTGLRLVLVGTLLLLLPAFFGHAPFTKPFQALGWLGVAVLVLGIALVAFFGKAADPTAAASTRQRPRAGKRKFEPLRQGATDDTAETAPARSSASAPHPQPSIWGRPVFEAIEWRRFEAVVERLFQQAGFETRSQAHGADGGVDIWLHSRHQPGAPVSLVQCKHWQGRRVGVDKVRELRGVMAARQVRRGQFATTSTFTPEAIAFAKETGIHLLDVDALLALIGQRTEAEQAELLAVALEGDYWRPTCVNCGSKMVERQVRSSGAAFWGCPGFPKCRTTMPMRSA